MNPMKWLESFYINKISSYLVDVYHITELDEISEEISSIAKRTEFDEMDIKMNSIN